MNHADFEHALTSLRLNIVKELNGLAGDTSLAEDAYQDACISAIKRGSRSFESRDKLKHFLAASAHGDLITRRGREAIKYEDYHEPLMPATATPSPENAYVLAIDLPKALSDTPESWKAIIQEILEGRISLREGAEELCESHMRVWREIERVKSRLQ